MTTDVLTRNGKDIAFASYSPLWKFQRKLVHSALAMFRDGSLTLEKLSKCFLNQAELVHLPRECQQKRGKEDPSNGACKGGKSQVYENGQNVKSVENTFACIQGICYQGSECVFKSC